jgi:sulfur carrier protein
MRIIINGSDLTVAEEVSLEALLMEQGFNPATVVVAVNNDIIQPENFPSTAIREEDCLDVMAFVGGG